MFLTSACDGMDTRIGWRPEIHRIQIHVHREREEADSEKRRAPVASDNASGINIPQIRELFLHLFD